MVIIVKRLGGGRLLGAFLARRNIINTWQPRSYDSTYEGNLVSTASALVCISVIEECNLMHNAQKIGT